MSRVKVFQRVRSPERGLIPSGPGLEETWRDGDAAEEEKRGGGGRGPLLVAVETPLFPRCFICSWRETKVVHRPHDTVWVIDLFALSRRSLAGNNAAQRYTLIRRYPPVTIHEPSLSPPTFVSRGSGNFPPLLSLFLLGFARATTVGSARLSSFFRAGTLKKLGRNRRWTRRRLPATEGGGDIKYSMNSEAALCASRPPRALVQGDPENFRIKFLPPSLQHPGSSSDPQFSTSSNLIVLHGFTNIFNIRAEWYIPIWSEIYCH